MITWAELKRAEYVLRQDDKALRLRMSMENPFVLVERKTFRGRVGCYGPNGLVWLPDAGRRREEGHVPVATIHKDWFSLNDLRYSLRVADSWRRWDHNARPMADLAHELDEQKAAKTKADRSDNLRYKTNELYDRFVWKMKSRIAGGI